MYPSLTNSTCCLLFSTTILKHDLSSIFVIFHLFCLLWELVQYVYQKCGTTHYDFNICSYHWYCIFLHLLNNLSMVLHAVPWYSADSHLRYNKYLLFKESVSKASLLDKYSFLAHSWLFIFHIVFPIFWVDPCEHLSHVFPIWWDDLCEHLSHEFIFPIFWDDPFEHLLHEFPIFWDDLCKHLSHMFSIFWDDLCEHLSHEFPIFWDDHVNIFPMSSPSSEMIVWIFFTRYFIPPSV